LDEFYTHISADFGNIFHYNLSSILFQLCIC